MLKARKLEAALDRFPLGVEIEAGHFGDRTAPAEKRDAQVLFAAYRESEVRAFASLTVCA